MAVMGSVRRARLVADVEARVDRGELGLREAVRRMRRAMGHTQADFARMVGISARVLIEFERGIGNPTLKTLEKILAPLSLELTLRRVAR